MKEKYFYEKRILIDGSEVELVVIADCRAKPKVADEEKMLVTGTLAHAHNFKSGQKMLAFDMTMHSRELNLPLQEWSSKQVYNWFDEKIKEGYGLDRLSLNCMS